MAAQDRRDEILKAAVKIFSEKGYSASTTSGIAKEAGVAEGTIFRYFKTKKDILTGVTFELIDTFGKEQITGKLLKLINENKDKSQHELLKLILKDRMELINIHKEEILIILSEAKYHEDIREAFVKNIIQRGIAIISEFINKGIKEEEFREINTTIAIRSILGILGAYILQEEMFQGVLQMNLDSQLDEILDFIFYGISKERK